MSRITARRHAFNLIYQFPFHPDVDVEGIARLKADYYDFLDEAGLAEYGLVGLRRPKGGDTAYIDNVVWGVFDKQNWLDKVIENFLQDWTLERISRIDLAILRLAIYEMLRELDVPPGVAINEAVELAKIYGTDESPAFINGVLGNVAREMLQFRERSGHKAVKQGAGRG